MKILIVSGEYPPMKGGVGRYAANLSNALRKRVDTEIFLAVGKKASEENNTSNDDVITDRYNDHSRIYYGIIRKGDPCNSQRLLDLVKKIKPDLINIQYERGLYENDSDIQSMIRRLLYGSTLHKFLKKTPVPIITTLHTVMPPEEYKQYVKERAARKEGRFAFLPQPIRYIIRKWALERRYSLLFEPVNLSDNIISPAKTVKNVIKKGTIIYHGAEPASSSSSDEKYQYRREFGLPETKRLLLAFGYVGSYKGFDILNNIQLPIGWTLVVKQNKHERGIEQPIDIKNAINLHLSYLDDLSLSKLFFSCDAIIFPYRIVSISGVMFDALAHGLPFVSSNLEFFKEFAEMGLGITCCRDTKSFSDALQRLAVDYDIYKKKVKQFNSNLRWDDIARQHVYFFQKHSKTNSV